MTADELPWTWAGVHRAATATTPPRRIAGVLWRGRLDSRTVAVTATLCAAAAGLLVWSLVVGDFPLAVSDVVAELVGAGTADTEFIVGELRLPRGLTALAAGAAFGMSGAIIQRLVGNPLASPDIVGVNAGAAVAAVFAIVVLHADSTVVTAAALGGAAVSTAATYLLAFRRGMAGLRFVLVGIGMTAMLTAVTHYLLTRAEIYDVQRAMVWLTGSLNGATWDGLPPVAITLAVAGVAALALGGRLRLLDLGDDTARGLGVNVERTRGGLLLCAVALAATATATTGPVGFVAFLAPQIARRLTGAQAIGLLPAAATGAVLMVGADIVGRRLFAPTELPVGVITAVLGAPYLLALLARSNRIGAGG